MSGQVRADAFHSWEILTWIDVSGQLAWNFRPVVWIPQTPHIFMFQKVQVVALLFSGPLFCLFKTKAGQQHEFNGLANEFKPVRTINFVFRFVWTQIPGTNVWIQENKCKKNCLKVKVRISFNNKVEGLVFWTKCLQMNLDLHLCVNFGTYKCMFNLAWIKSAMESNISAVLI